MAEEKKSTMTYRYLGNTGLKVSVLSFGTMLTSYYKKDCEQWLECAKAAYDYGKKIRYFDSAEIYGMGDGDRLLGRAIKEFGWERKSLVIAIKLLTAGAGSNDNFMSRKHIIEGCKDSLERMGLDYCDLIFSHRPDFDTPLEETCRAFTLITEAIEICKDLGLHAPVADQCQYNCLVRDEAENLYTRVFDRYGYGTTVWSPLAGGLLSGKYNDGSIPEDSRYGRSEEFKNFAMQYLGMKDLDERKKMFDTLVEISTELGCKQAELVLAWVLVNRDVSTCIFGASRVEQVDSNIKALEIASKWTPEIEERINTALGNEPKRETNWLNWMPFPSRRKEKVTYLKINFSYYYYKML